MELPFRKQISRQDGPVTEWPSLIGNPSNSASLLFLRDQRMQLHCKVLDFGIEPLRPGVRAAHGPTKGVRAGWRPRTT